MTTCATTEGTRRYARRFAGRAADGHFREAHRLIVSSLGIGTYLGRPDDIVAGSHCITPQFLNDQLARSLRNLGVDCIDVYYLHNPETQLGEISRPDFYERVRDAFAFLESAAAEGKIQYYGMATWNG